MIEGQVEMFGRYRVYEQLGAGGMAQVDRAELAGSDGGRYPVALKRMLPDVARNEEMVQAFLREARLASHLQHANVARTYEFGQVNGVHFIAMELVTGPTLRDILKHCAQTTGPMPVPIALNLLSQICDALDYAHNLCDQAGQPLGIIHRDVSPSNIILDPAGVAKLIDFGIAKAATAGVQTVAGVVKGKFGYMAPEYLLGRIDARADLFAVGVIAHELLTNRPLFSVTDDMETLRRLRTMPLQPPSRTNPHVPPEIDDIVMTALARDPDQRWQHATALRTAVATLTRRLGLVCTNRQVIDWIAWAFTQTGSPEAKHPADTASVYDLQLSYSNLQIEESTRSTLAAGPSAAITAQPSPAETTLAGEPTMLGMPGELRARPMSVPPISPPLPRAPSVPPLPRAPSVPPIPPPRAPAAFDMPLAAAPPARRVLRIIAPMLLAAGLAAAGVALVLGYLT